MRIRGLSISHGNLGSCQVGDGNDIARRLSDTSNRMVLPLEVELSRMGFAHPVKVPLGLLGAVIDLTRARFGTMSLAETLRLDNPLATDDAAKSALVLHQVVGVLCFHNINGTHALLSSDDEGVA